MLLLDLPTSVAAELLTLWLRVADTVRLDTACCNVLTRPPLMELFKSTECSARPFTLEQVTLNKEVIDWAATRHVLFGHIFVDDECNGNALKSYLQAFGRRVSAVVLRNARFANLVGSIALCSNLRTLDVHMGLLPDTFPKLFKNCHHLREFRCDLVGYISARHIRKRSNELADLSCPNLKLVSLKWDRGFALFAAAILRLADCAEVVIVRNGDDSSTSTILQSMNPTVTAFCKTTKFSKLGRLMPAKELLPLFAKFPHLVLLDLPGCRITLDVVNAMGTHLKLLQSLNVSHSHEVTDIIIRALASACGDRLTELLVCQCDFLTVGGMQETLPRFTQLTSFGMYYSQYSSTPSDFSMLSRFSSLTVIFGGRKVVPFLMKLAMCCPDVQHLRLGWFDGVYSVQDVDVLVQHCTQLRSLHANFAESPDVTKYLCAWRKTRPNLKVNERFDVCLAAMRGYALTECEDASV